MGYSMNKLVEYLGERYHPGGDALKIALATGLIERSGFTVNYYNPFDGINMTLIQASILAWKRYVTPHLE